LIDNSEFVDDKETVNGTASSEQITDRRKLFRRLVSLAALGGLGGLMLGQLPSNVRAQTLVGPANTTGDGVAMGEDNIITGTSNRTGLWATVAKDAGLLMVNHDTGSSGFSCGIHGDSAVGDSYPGAGVVGTVDGRNPSSTQLTIPTGVQGLGTAGTGVYGESSSGKGVYGLSATTSPNQNYGVMGEIDTPGVSSPASPQAQAAAVYGLSTSTNQNQWVSGVLGVNQDTTNPYSVAVTGVHEGKGWGVYGQSNTGIGGVFQGTQAAIWAAGKVGVNTDAPLNPLDVVGAVAVGTYAGVNTAPSNGLIVSGNVGIGTSTPTGPLQVVSSANNRNIIEADATGTDSIGVYGYATGTGTSGVSGFSLSGTGVEGGSSTGYGVAGSSVSNLGVYGYSSNTGSSGFSCGIHGDSAVGDSYPGAGVVGTVDGRNPSSAPIRIPAGVIGLANVGYGVYGGSNSGIGVYGYSSSSTGVVGYGSTGGTFVGSPAIYANGNVGVQTSTPECFIHIGGGATSDIYCGMGPHPNTLVSGSYVGPAMNYGYSGSTFGEGSGFFNVRPDPNATAPNPSLRFMTVNVQRMIITNTGNVGIGTSSPAHLIQLSGGAYSDGTTWNPSSSVRWKENIEPLTGGVETLKQLHPVAYNYKKTPAKRTMGFIAEEVGKVLPTVVDWDKAEPGYAEGYDQISILALAVQAVKEQQATIQEQQRQIDELRAEIMELKRPPKN
jgi:hypothetical protein